MPSLEKLSRHFKDAKFELVGIDMGEDQATVGKSVKKHGLSYANLLDETGQVSSMFGIRSTPAKMLIDKQGNVIASALGYKDWDNDEFKELIQKLIDQ
ncbi:MAG: TlpA family protein disulfide reductase [Nitrospira sp.]|nr:TlpA family protein disulfide reductase [Nitrospira sp.]